ncbi:unnamed protein product [Oppiella nova]|uniref:Uncharacterized protein n=1 Tax=Oppiella nova TaxID=334625 RepID=A0A7R9LQ45_9ACAR|nr:unnamed protein product [Oppiella nova]CAG2165863.1 unnamed protein product [Oppiella nova]
MNNYLNSEVYYYFEQIIQKYWDIVYNSSKLQVWVLSVVCCVVIGVSTMFPLFLISFSNNNCLINTDSSSKTLLKYLLSFAVGGLLGDVFLHLLPEASHQLLSTGINARHVQLYLGLWTLIGILCFAFTESFFSHIHKHNQQSDGSVNHCCNTDDQHITNDGICKTKCAGSSEAYKVNIMGYLNLLANAFDNLTHGVAVGASFLVSIKMGFLTTFAIAIHEIPHEIADFAILIKSGFNKWQAVRAQASIAGVTVFGCLLILLADSTDAIDIQTVWILPFTSGGFLYISLVSILPELLSEANFDHSIKQTLFIIIGVSVMAFVNLIAD